jgi:hypothetical protein
MNTGMSWKLKTVKGESILYLDKYGKQFHGFD